ncbi:MAG: protein kinase [Candidatus Brocadiae bacterium]|nr:protein kinase [Candidatus Brocadiia bacterium]
MEYSIVNAAEKYSTFTTPEKKRKHTGLEPKWEIGQIIDEKYEIQDIIAKDSNKIIHKVKHCQWNIPLAVRSQMEKESQVRFFNQAQRWVELGKHPNVVGAYYVQNICGVPRLFVEYVSNGKTLDFFMAAHKQDMEIELILDIAIQIAWGMKHAHQKGLLHGDLRPANIFITEEGEAKVADFRSREGINLEYTPYMPPEQFEKDRPMETSVDIYSFGMILYELCTGELPFKVAKRIEGEEALENFRNILLTQPPLPPHKVEPKIPVSFSDTIMRCLALEPKERIEDFDEIARTLQEIYLQFSGFSYPREAPNEAALMAVDWNNRALSFLDFGQEEKAQEYLEEAVKSDSQCTGALINLHLLKLRKGKSDLSQLLSETKRFLKIDPEVVTFYRSKICLEQGGFLEEAFAEVEQACEEFPKNKELLRMKGILQYRLGQYEKALFIFEDLSKTEIPLKKDLYYFATSYLQMGKKKQALEVLEKALALFPEDLDFLLAQAIGMAMQGKLEETYHQFQKMASSSDSFWGYLHLAEINSAFSVYMKSYKKAIPNKEEASQLYEKLLKKAPNLPRVIQGYEKALQKKILAFPEPGEDEIQPLWSYSKSLGKHEHGVHCISVSPDGRLVLVGGADEYIKLWEIESGVCKNTLRGHKEGTLQIAISHDGHFAVSIGRDSVALVWDLITGECVGRLEGHVRDITSLSLTGSGYLITASIDKTLRIWDLGSLSCRKILRGHTDKINYLATTSDGRYVISASEDRKVGLWEIEQGILVNFLEGHTEGVTCLAVSSDNSWVVSGSWDQKIRIFDLDSGECKGVLEGHKGTLNCLAISADSKWIISGSEDKTVRVWDVESKKCFHILEGHKVDVTCIALIAGSPFLVSGSWDRTLRIWHLYSGKCISTLEGHTDLVNTIAVAPNGSFIVSGGDDPLVRIWTDLTTESCILLEEPKISYLLQSPRSRQANFEIQRKVEKWIKQADEKLKEEKPQEALGIYRTVQQQQGFQSNPKVLDAIYKAASQGKFPKKDVRQIWKYKVLEGHRGPITCLAISPSQESFVSGSKDGTLKIWNVKEGKCVATLEGHKSEVSCVDISPNGRFVVSGGHDKMLRLWEWETGRCIYAMEGHDHWVEHVRITPDGREIISGSRDNNIRIWERKSGHRLYLLNNHTDLISSLLVTPDGRYLVSSSHDRTLRVWDLESGQCLHNLERHTDHVKSIALVPNTTLLISCGWDNLLYLWDIQKGDVVRSFIGHQSWVNAICVSHDGTKAVSASLDKTLHIWEIATGKCLAVLYGHSEDINSVLLTEDGRFCISISTDSIIKIWDLDTYQCCQTLQGHSAEITALKSLSHFRYMITGSKDNTIILWEFDWLWE